MPETLEFFFDFASPYSYLASTQLEGIAARTSAQIRWRPFYLGGVFKATGATPIFEQPAKFAQLRLDVEDWARHYGLPPLTMPDPFPLSSLLANRLAFVAEDEGKLVPFVHAVYRAVFARREDVAKPEAIGRVLSEVGLDPATSIVRAGSQQTKDRLKANTDEAVARGAFGAPTFFAKGRMFFGNDRLGFLEQALGAK